MSAELAPPPDSTTKRNPPMATTTDQLREIADLIEQHPELPHPYVMCGSWGCEATWQVTIETDDLGEQRAMATNIVKTLRGKWNKAPLGVDGFHFIQTRPSGLQLSISCKREAVCERVVVGTEKVYVAAVAARAEVRYVVEWRCEPLLAGDQS